MSIVTSVSSYLEAVSVGIRQSSPGEIPGRLTEIIRNLEHFREQAERELTAPPEDDGDY